MSPTRRARRQKYTTCPHHNLTNRSLTNRSSGAYRRKCPGARPPAEVHHLPPSLRAVNPRPKECATRALAPAIASRRLHAISSDFRPKPVRTRNSKCTFPPPRAVSRWRARLSPTRRARLQKYTTCRAGGEDESGGRANQEWSALFEPLHDSKRMYDKRSYKRERDVDHLE